ncbi:MAG: EpsG family protein [Fusobacterium sp.]
MSNLHLFIIVEVLLAMLMFFEQYKNKYRKIYLIIGSLILTTLISLRKNTPDLGIYETLYYFPDHYEVEKGYLFFQNLFRILNLDFIYFKVVIAMITISLLYRGFYKLVKYPNAAMFIYTAYSFLEKPYVQVRNALSIAIFINILPLIIDRKKLKSCIGILIAAFFHITGYLYFFIEIFNIFNIKITKKKIKILFLSTLILSGVLCFIDVASILLKISSYNLGRISERIQIYFLSEEGKKYIGSSPFGIRSLFSPFVYIIYFFKIEYLNKKFFNNFFKEKYIFILFSLFLLFKQISYKIIIFGRVAGTFDISETLALTLMLEIKNKYLKIFYMFFLIFYVFLSNYITGKNLNLW